MHVHTGQQVHHVSTFGQGNPVELHILACGEVAVVGAQQGRRAGKFVLRGLGVGQHCDLRGVVVSCNARQHLELRRRDHAVRDRHTQHGCVALHIPAVLQAQGTELVFTQLARLPAAQLVAKFRSAGADKGLVEFGVLVHTDRKKNQIKTSLVPAHASKPDKSVRITRSGVW